MTNEQIAAIEAFEALMPADLLSIERNAGGWTVAWLYPKASLPEGAAQLSPATATAPTLAGALIGALAGGLNSDQFQAVARTTDFFDEETSHEHD